MADLEVVQESHASQESAKYGPRRFLHQAVVSRHHAEQLASGAERQDHVHVFVVLQRLDVMVSGERSLTRSCVGMGY